MLVFCAPKTLCNSRDDDIVEQCKSGVPARAAIRKGERVGTRRDRVVHVDCIVVQIRRVSIWRELERADVDAVDRERHIRITEWIRGCARDNTVDVNLLSWMETCTLGSFPGCEEACTHLRM